MPPQFAFDVFSDLTDLDTPDVRLTVGDQLVDAEYTHGEVSSNGRIEIHGDHPDVQYLAKRNWVKVSRIDVDPEEVKGGFFLEEGEFRALDKREQVGRTLTFSGPGGLQMFDRYVLGHAIYAPLQTHRGDVDIPDKWTWGDVPYGAILTRVIEEGKHSPGSAYLPFSPTFDRDFDSLSNPWDDIGDYQVDIGTSGLKVATDMMKLGVIIQVDGLLAVNAFDASNYGEDRTSATFAAGKVRFEAGVNILSDLPKRIAASRARTHVLMRGRTGDYQTVDEDINGDPLSPPTSYKFFKSDTTANVATLEKMGKLHLTRLRKTEDQCKVRHLIGPGGADGEEGYNPGPFEDYWVGDRVTVDTGDTEYDYSEQPIEVAAVRFYLEKGNWVAEAQLGAQYLDPGIEGASSLVSRAILEVPGMALCDPTIEPTGASVLFTRTWDYENGDATTESTAHDRAWPAVLNGGVGAPLPAFGGSNYGRSTSSPSISGGARMPCTPGGLVTLEGKIARNWFSETFATKAYTIRFYAASSGGSAISSEILSPPPCSRSVAAVFSLSIFAPTGANYFTLQLADNAAQDDVTVTSYDTDGEAGSIGELPLDTVRQGDESAGTSIKAPRCDHQHAHGLLNFDGTDYHDWPSNDLVLDDIADVDASSPSDGDTLTYDSGTGTWVPSAGGSGAPTTADYLVGTAQGGLSGEIVVGTSPGGELGGTWAAPTLDFVSIAKWGTD